MTFHKLYDFLFNSRILSAIPKSLSYQSQASCFNKCTCTTHALKLCNILLCATVNPYKIHPAIPTAAIYESQELCFHKCTLTSHVVQLRNIILAALQTSQTVQETIWWWITANATIWLPVYGLRHSFNPSKEQLLEIRTTHYVEVCIF